MKALAPPLTPRLAAIADAIAPASRVADVGSDHGLLPLWLAATGRASFCLATERSADRMAGISRPLRDASWAERIGYRVGDGLAALRPDDRIDTVVLAGLGGRSIARLLAVPEIDWISLRRIVLQPRSEPARVRRFLSSHGWRLVAERLTDDRGRLHLTLTAERGDDGDLYLHPVLSRDDLWTAGPLLVRSPSAEMEGAWRSEKNRWTSILAGARPGSSAARARAGLDHAVRVLAAISRPAE